MKHHYWDQYSHNDTFFHRIPSLLRVCLLLFLIFFINSPFFDYLLFWYLLALSIVIIVFSKIPFGFVIKRSFVFIPFVFLVGISLVFIKKGGPCIFEYHILNSVIRVHDQGLKAFTQIVSKSYLSLIYIIVFLSSIPFMDLLKSLQSLRVPRIFIVLFSFMYRYIFVFIDEIAKGLMAKELRAQNEKRFLDLKVFSYLIGGLFLKSYDRAERVYMAMNLKGFDGTVRTMSPVETIGIKDLSFPLFVVVSVIGLSFM